MEEVIIAITIAVLLVVLGGHLAEPKEKK